MIRDGKATSWSDEQVAAALSSANTKLKALRDKLREPLAVIGVGCRFPQASSPDQFWELLKQGRCAITETPGDRWDASLKAAHDKEPGKVTANRGGFLQETDQFDAAFFGIARREAETIDPQQRLLLEVTWETVEHAGLDASQLRASRTGVFVGICSNDYLHRLTTRDRHSIDAYLGTGNAHGAAAGRVSYFMNWQGPSVAIDTACSSSLTAVHLAARSLRYDDCDLALVAGVNLILTPELSVNLSQAGMLSPTGLCHTFDSAADGFVRGEGCGAVLLKRLSRAVADGDRILCVVRGTASNQDGRSNGLTAPNGISQQAVIRAALADADVTPEQIDYLEAHGTGTQLGDPIEMSALGAVFGPGRDCNSPLRVGSVKTNIGHLEGAAGIAGMIKVALALDHERLPAHLHFNAPSPHIDWSLPIQVPTEMTKWERGDRVRLAGISSFGFGGTNAHIVMEEAPPVAPASDSAQAPQAAKHLLSVSAKSPAVLRQVAARYAALARNGCSLDNLCHTANVGRSHFDHRLAVVAETVEEMVEELELFQATGQTQGGFVGSTKRDFGVHWLMGDQLDWYKDAGRNLSECHSTFRAELDRCGKVLTNFWPRPLNEILQCDESELDDGDALLALFCLQFATAQLWRAWGISPNVIVGQEIGEYAAASTAGVFSLEDGVRMVTRRAELFHAATNRREMEAGMAAVAKQTTFTPPKYTYISNRDGNVASADYWADPLLESTTDVMRTIQRAVASSGVQLILEMGVAGSLSADAGDAFSVLPGLNAPQSEWPTAVENLARLYAAGATINWGEFAGGSGRRISLPTYPFERRRYWFTDKTARLDAPTTVSAGNRCAHPLLGMQLDLGGREVVFETDFEQHSYLRDHRISASTVFPAAGFLELAMAAGCLVSDQRLDLVDLTISIPISWAETESCRIQVILAPASDGYECRIVRHVGKKWQTAAECRLVPAEKLLDSAPLLVAPDPASTGGQEADVAEHYRRCRQLGVDYGPSFQGIRQLVAGSRQAWGEIERPENLACSDYLLHPAVLDSCFQVSAALMREQHARAWLPVSVARYCFIRSPAADMRLRTQVQIHDSDDDEIISVDLRIADCDGSLVAEVRELVFKPTRRQSPPTTQHAVVQRCEIVADLLAKSPSQAHVVLRHYLYRHLGAIMDLDVDEIPADQPLNSLGLDSLMAFDLRDDLERDLGVTVPFEVFLQDLSLEDFAVMLLNKLKALHRSADGSILAANVPTAESRIEGAI